MKLFILGTVLLLLSVASLADAQPSGTAPPAISDATSGAKAPSSGDGCRKRSEAKGPANSCRRAASGTCKGCSVTCAEGERAVCTSSLYNWNSNKCVRDATCLCKATRSRS